MKKTYLILASIALLVPACSKDPNVKELEKAANAVEQMVAPFHATRSSFFVVLPDGSPKQFVSWYFSSLGVADWAPVDQPGEMNQDEIDAMRQTGMPLRPTDVFYRHSTPDTSVQKQVVLKWNDAEGLVILEGYLSPTQEPVFTRSFKLPKGVVPDDLARITTQSNLEMGMAYQSF
jgi:hypothetical protein